MEFQLGESVKITSGPLADFDGEITDVNADQQKLQVMVNIFERQVPVEARIRQRQETGLIQMAKKVLTLIKLQIPGGQANPAPPVGPALGPHGVNIMEFCKAFNAQTASQNGRIIPVEITVFEDRTVHVHHEDAAGGVPDQGGPRLETGSAEPNRDKVGTPHRAQVRQIAQTKLPDLNARDIDQATKIIAGTARSMGVEVEPVSTRGKRYVEARGHDRPRARVYAGRGGTAC